MRAIASDISIDAPSLLRIGDAHVARDSRGRLKICETQVSRILLSTT
jgi:hypothetical protein